MSDKIKVLVLSDHPLSPSGVGIQTRYMIQGLLDKHPGKYSFYCLGGAVKHEDYKTIQVQPYENDWLITPVDGYGTPDMIRSVLRIERPNIVWLMTDPRFWGWLWEMDNEIRPLVPIIYYHVWDNYPYPTFNKAWYSSNDLIATISKVTSDIVQNVSPEVAEKYLPHTANTEIFKKLPDDVVAAYKNSAFESTVPDNKDKFIFFWNNRNARRKQSGTILFWFKEFLDEVGHDKATLIMHTEPDDPHGQPLDYLISEFGLGTGQAMLSTVKMEPQRLADIYNMADCTINIADAEGFGLSTFESLCCETPIIVSMTGGLQEQVTDGENWFGIGIEPSSKTVIGSQEVPWIFEDRLAKEDFISACKKMLNMPKKERDEMGAAGRQYILKNYSFEKYITTWDETLTEVHENYGSWENRKNYCSWEFKEVA